MMDQKKNDELFDCFLTQALNDCAREEWKAAAEDSSEVKLSEKTEKAMQKLLREQKHRRFTDRFACKKQTYLRIASAVAAALILVISSTVAPYRAKAEGNHDFYAYNDQKRKLTFAEIIFFLVITKQSDFARTICRKAIILAGRKFTPVRAW